VRVLPAGRPRHQLRLQLTGARFVADLKQFVAKRRGFCPPSLCFLSNFLVFSTYSLDEEQNFSKQSLSPLTNGGYKAIIALIF
jgi:hypothetical protein